VEFLGDLYKFVAAISWEWWVIMTTVEGVLGLVNRYTKVEEHRRHFVTAALVVFYLAIFQAWRTEYHLRLTAEAATSSAVVTPKLSAQQHRILELLASHQLNLGLDKLTFAYDGTVPADDSGHPAIDFVAEMYGDYRQTGGRKEHVEKLTMLIESLPKEYVTILPAQFWDRRHAVRVTEEGFALVNNKTR
jgi:hypothetical protein